jgi:purine-nucleoside phosphorylase
MGRRVAAISCITNLAAGVTGEAMNHQEVLDNAKIAQEGLSKLLTETIRMFGGANG